MDFFPVCCENLHEVMWSSTLEERERNFSVWNNMANDSDWSSIHGINNINCWGILIMTFSYQHEDILEYGRNQGNSYWQAQFCWKCSKWCSVTSNESSAHQEISNFFLLQNRTISPILPVLFPTEWKFWYSVCCNQKLLLRQGRPAWMYYAAVNLQNNWNPYPWTGNLEYLFIFTLLLIWLNLTQKLYDIVGSMCCINSLCFVTKY